MQKQYEDFLTQNLSLVILIIFNYYTIGEFGKVKNTLFQGYKFF